MEMFRKCTSPCELRDIKVDHLYESWVTFADNTLFLFPRVNMCSFIPYILGWCFGSYKLYFSNLRSVERTPAFCCLHVVSQNSFCVIKYWKSVFVSMFFIVSMAMGFILIKWKRTQIANYWIRVRKTPTQWPPQTSTDRTKPHQDPFDLPERPWN